MKIILKAPQDEIGRTMVIPNDLHAMQELVGGYIEIGLRMGDAQVDAES